MVSFHRILETAIFSMINLFPFMLLALYPFRRQFRFGKPVTLLLIFLLMAVQVGVGITAAFADKEKGILSAVSTAVYVLFYFVGIKASFGKMLFTLLMLSNVANVVTIDAKCLEGLIFGAEMARQSYRFTYSVCMLLCSAAAAVPIFWYFRRYYSDGLSKQSGALTWNYLWLIPATFYLSWFWHIYGSSESALEIAMRPSSALLMLFINLGAFLIYHTVVRLIYELEENQRLASRNYQLAVQSLQYEKLSRQIDDARQARHDIRHHITILDALLSAGKYEQLHQYLQSYKKSLPDGNPIKFCEHYVVNTVLLYFQQQAAETQTAFHVSADLPAQIRIPDEVLSVLLGNLLENAVEACREVQNGKKEIIVRVRTEEDAFFVQIENTCGNKTVRDGENRYLSTKESIRGGRGIGMESVRNIVLRYDGLFEAEEREGRFCVSAFLNLSAGEV
ncbi:sensor histidine kinase [Acetatifactor muris]|jgi:two-component system sensor histidine kinase AgrC|uniref:sensor histidine kinase n=1 Tax=Acetatifactor muris TaxID=879566 RepID=UPI0023F2B17C|nr:sensor histidine kinase [Acetatifactor muris]MCI8798968.1 GHKL domain-containing protein [Lachnospiraceae bacterium]